MKAPAPLDREQILTPEWLSEALSQHHGTVQVKAVAVVETLQTQATKIRFTVDYAHAPADLPRALCVKGLFGPEPQRLLAAGISATEARFYLQIAPRINLRVPRLVYGAVDATTRHGLIVMEDVIAAGGEFLTALNPYTMEQAAASLMQLAQLHASSWQGQGIEQLDWVPAWLPALAVKPLLPQETLQELFDGPRGEPLPGSMRSAARLHEAIRRLAARTQSQPKCLVHGDVHAGNLFENDQGPGLVDWQMLQQGSWTLDLAYHLGAVLSPEDRANSEQHLVRHYLECLRALGVDPPSFDIAWDEYRAHMVYGYYMWAITRLVEPRITNEFVRRLGLAVIALESYQLLGV